ncbi:MAG TPA: glutamate synthase large subunit [Armatimonadota bacterium]|jgi:glutamate synthase (ferredoxin)
MARNGTPSKQGLYDPRYEHDSCGIGLVADIKGRKSHDILRQALTVLVNLDHRGARGSEANTGDGAGVQIQMPHAFFEKASGFDLPPAGHYGVGMVFLPQDALKRRECETVFNRIVREEGQRLIGWRDVPTDSATLGDTAKSGEPAIRQVFIARGENVRDSDGFERKLYVIRKRAENALRHAEYAAGAEVFYVCSLSARTIVYKGMLTPMQVDEYFQDLADPAMETCMALVHSRFSTNTFPSWERAHPYRYTLHNGEINTLRGNVNWMTAREGNLRSYLFGNDLRKVLPIIDPNGSDSAMFDNWLELLILSGWSLPKAIMSMIPEPWANHDTMSDDLKAFYEFQASLMEPWDGPAAMAFTDGIRIAAVLDRNGLRPSRYYVTTDDRVILASEVGVVDIPPEKIARKGRIQPGRMLLIDTEEGRIVPDKELKRKLADEHPYRQWLTDNLVPLENLPSPPHIIVHQDENLLKRLRAFGYTNEDMSLILGPMAQEGQEPLGSMGIDTPLAVLSDRSQLLYNYFKQIFAQVTNPPIDAIREEIVTSTGTVIGPEKNLLHPVPESCHQIKLKTPILSNFELEQIRHNGSPGLKAITIPILYKVAQGGHGLEKAMWELRRDVRRAIAEGCNVIILSDRQMDRDNAPIPALLAVAGLHHHLVEEEMRTKVGLVLESGEPREVHHMALLIGYGAGAINPYLAYDAIHAMIGDGSLTGLSPEEAEHRYAKALTKGVVKTMSKMGISTIHSYRGAQIFEAVGLHHSVVNEYFRGTPSRIEGIGLKEIAREVQIRHERAMGDRKQEIRTLDSGGEYQWRADGEVHLFNPQTIHKLQKACRAGDYKLFKEYTAAVNEQSTRQATIRGLMEFRPPAKSIPIDEVEPVEAIVKRFKTGAMSYGSISQEAHESLAIAMNRLGGKSNTGEGGEDPSRLYPNGDGVNKCSAIKQVASARFGVTSEYLVSAKEIQIKMAQGAKPGEGGQLPGNKVYPWIARVRHSTPGVGLISPPPHHDIYSIEDLAELIHDLKNANEKARISVKLVSVVGVGTIAAGVAKAHADVVLISGYDGGTGASPRSSIRHAGLPWELGLAETHQTLLMNDLRSRIVIETDGKLMTGRDLAVAALLGAEEFGFATAPLIVLGCVMMRVCHKDTCPVGVATQNPELRKRFTGDPEHVENFMRFVAQELREYMAELGFRTINDMVGHTERLNATPAIDHWKARGLDLSSILHMPAVGPNIGHLCCIAQEHGIERALDKTDLVELCAPALESGEPVRTRLPIRNTNRAVGTILGSEVTRRFGTNGLPPGTIRLHFQGTAGQSFGAFIPSGLTLILEGDANDYVGKGLSGGRIIAYPPDGTTFVAEENVIIGNVALYGATSGEAFIRGQAGERFAVRNSGATAVVEGVGDHACEYMTGGRVIVLGRTGRNFAAGMSGGVAYVLDERGEFGARCNTDMVSLGSLEDHDEINEIKLLVRQHHEVTCSSLAARIMAEWDDMVPKFVKVMPKDYKRMLDAIGRAHAAGLSGDEAIMAAFDDNKRDLARVGGN